MNKRIIELAEQAGSTHKQNLGVYQFYTHELEKFAESIIRECADIATINQYQSYTPGHYVLKHFGVE
jgi:hypothetical protein